MILMFVFAVIALLFVFGAVNILSGWLLPANAHVALWRAVDSIMGLIAKLFVVAVGLGIVALIITVARG